MVSRTSWPDVNHLALTVHQARTWDTILVPSIKSERDYSVNPMSQMLLQDSKTHSQYKNHINYMLYTML